MSEPELKLSLKRGKKAFFVSDVHLVAEASKPEEKQREASFCRFLQSIEKEAHCLFLLGDIFDFWFEYRRVCLRGYFSVLHQLHILAQNTEIFFMGGNHDMWAGEHLQNDIGFRLLTHAQRVRIHDTRFFLAHGDGLSDQDHVYKFVKKYVFTSPFFIRLFRLLHPDLGYAIARRFCKVHRSDTADKERQNQPLIQYAYQLHQQNPSADYYVMGHMHAALLKEIHKGVYYANLGEWLREPTYGVFSEETGFEIRRWAA